MYFLTAGTYSAMSIVDQQTIFSTAAITGVLDIAACNCTAQTSRFFGTPKCDTHACKEFVKTKGLGQVVIRTQIKRLNLDRFLIMGRKYNDWCTAPFS